VRLKRSVHFCLSAGSEAAALELMGQPHHALAKLPVFRELKLENRVLSGFLAAPFALLGEVRFPFSSRFEVAGETARLEPLPATDEELRAELSGKATVQGKEVCYQALIRLDIDLPQGEKWGGKAFRKMAEAAFERVLDATLKQIQG